MLHWLKKFRKESPRRFSDTGIRTRDIDPDAVKILHRLGRHGHTAYVVGGALRDLLLGIRPKDFDLATSARPYDIKKLFRNAIVIGRRFRLVHIRFAGGKFIETATFRRHHGQDSGDPVARDNVYGTEKEDAFRRDFTMNALFYDVQNAQIIDYTGGVEDLRARRIRCIGRPDERIREDPVRMLRAIKFAAKFGLAVEPGLEAAIRRSVESITLCSPRRLFEEFLKILRAGVLAAFVEKAREYGFFRVYLPYLHAMSEKDRQGFLRLARACDRAARDRPGRLDLPFAILLWPAVREKDAVFHDIQKSIRQTFMETAGAFPICKNDKFRIRALLALQPRFEYLQRIRSRKRGFLIKRFLKSPGFEEALALYRWIEEAETGSDRGYRFWQELAASRQQGIRRRELNA
jgi:poly(A) polymerase